MRFVGCALAWRPGEARDRASCLAVLDERGSIIANSFAADAGEIAAAIEDYVAERRGVVVGADAPLAVPNERGTRRIERILGEQHCDPVGVVLVVAQGGIARFQVADRLGVLQGL